MLAVKTAPTLKAKPGDQALGDNFQVTYSYFMSIRKPVIAAINGACAGLGLAVATMTDLHPCRRAFSPIQHGIRSTRTHRRTRHQLDIATSYRVW